jgi:hypothetical protein
VSPRAIATHAASGASAAWHRVPGTTSGGSANIPAVADEMRSERTARLLVARLEAVARAASELRHADVERLIELASVATMRAVALELIQEERAAAIWRDAHVRHPELPHVDVALPERLVA